MLTTRSDVRELVLQRVDFRVVSTNTDEDLTGSILLQIIVELESVDKPLFTTEILSEVIRFYGDTVQTAFTDYLERSLALFVEQQKLVQDQMRNVFTANPVRAMTELTKCNLEIWKDIQEDFLKTAGTNQAPRQQKAAKGPDKT